MLDRLGPKRIVIVSSAPQIRYPDCYGIDMSKLNEFVAFRAVLSLIKENEMESLLQSVYEKCLGAELGDPNHVKELYEPFDYEEVSEMVSKIVRPEDMKADLEVIYQTVANLHKACPNHSGDWYFTGEFPTIGGMKVVNKAFTNYMEGKRVRAY